MAKQPNIKILYSPEKTYPGTAQGNYVGAQSTAGRRGTLPTFTDGNSYFISKAGADANAGASATPKLTLASLFSTSQSYDDTSGNAYHLTQTGTVPYLSYPCNPIPPQGNYAAGPFSDSNYLNAPAGLYGALTGATQFCVEGWVFFNSLANAPYIWYAVDSSSFSGRANANGSLTFNIAGTEVSSSAGAVVTGQWYYIAFSFQSVTASAKKIWLGSSPANMLEVATATQTRTAGTVTSFTFGKIPGTANRYLDGYQDRMVVSSVQRSTFPIAPGTANILGFYEMETRPLMQTAPMNYIVVKDSGEYNEGLYANFQYDITAGFGIYAADGYAPTFKKVRGAVPGTYGAGNPSYVQLTSSTATTCFVSKAGNDGTGARGNSSLPFLTVQAAMTATTTAGDTVQIQDSAVYTENITVPNRALTLQAATGQVPVMRIVSGTAAATGHLTASGANAMSIGGIIFVGDGVAVSRFFTASGTHTISISSCSFSNYLTVSSATGTVTADSCYFSSVANGGYIQNSTNCFFAGGITLTARVGIGTAQTNCSFTGTVIASTFSSPTWMQFIKCDFTEAILQVAGGTQSNFGILDSDFNNPSGSSGISYNYLGSTGSGLIENCVFYGSSSSNWAVKSFTGSSVKILNCSAVGFENGFYFVGTQTNSSIVNCSSLNCTTAGVNAVSSVAAVGLADYGSGSAYTGGVSPTYSASAASYLSSVTTSPNITLTADSTAAFLVTTSQGLSIDAGSQSALFAVTVPTVTFDGLTLEGSVNSEGGINSLTAVTVKYCTFVGLGTYGINAPALSTISYNFYTTNGHAIKENSYSTTISYNCGSSCSGAFLQHFGRTTSIYNNSSYACAYGQFDSVAATFSQASNLVYASSGTYDYSGEAQLTYSCVGTLDPDRSGSVDTNSIRLDPLFRDPLAGDLRLMALAVGSLFDSPCKGESSSANDMGAFAYTYGDCELSWIEVDFGATSPSGYKYRNPDFVERSMVAVKLTENERENGAMDSSASAYKLEYDMTWNDVNDMPQEQRIELEDLFKNASNVVRCSFDGGSWFDAYLIRRAGFIYSEASVAGYVTGVPTALRELIIREA